jgi:hypothetical protein
MLALDLPPRYLLLTYPYDTTPLCLPLWYTLSCPPQNHHYDYHFPRRNFHFPGTVPDTSSIPLLFYHQPFFCFYFIPNAKLQLLLTLMAVLIHCLSRLDMRVRVHVLVFGWYLPWRSPIRVRFAFILSFIVCRPREFRRQIFNNTTRVAADWGCTVLVLKVACGLWFFRSFFLSGNDCDDVGFNLLGGIYTHSPIAYSSLALSSAARMWRQQWLVSTATIFGQIPLVCHK